MTSGKKILAFTGTVVLLLVVGRVGLGFLNQPDDKTLIVEAVKEAQKASREGQPGGVLDFLSLDLKLNGDETSGSRRNIADYVKNQKPDIEFTTLEPQIFGDQATIESDAKVKMGFGGFTPEVTIHDAKIYLKKEDDREWFIIPKKSWKITEIRASLSELPSLNLGS
ncbi:MAG: hypothetical protein JST12_21195 [Armatimonadetes bacterium]|nr:hypothetical protein [Armatimonadota bacterium]MBS1704193.1 hypothetical protein [Armatimonadota bacterium]MBS1726990.1 hypothetical protein [Armatimonadota bacterium]